MVDNKTRRLSEGSNVFCHVIKMDFCDCCVGKRHQGDTDKARTRKAERRPSEYLGGMWYHLEQAVSIIWVEGNRGDILGHNPSLFFKENFWILSCDGFGGALLYMSSCLSIDQEWAFLWCQSVVSLEPPKLAEHFAFGTCGQRWMTPGSRNRTTWVVPESTGGLFLILPASSMGVCKRLSLCLGCGLCCLFSAILNFYYVLSLASEHLYLSTFGLISST